MSWSSALEARYELLGGQVTERELAHGEPAWLTPALVATEAAHDKLSAWVARTPRPWTTPAPDQVLTQIAFSGDGWLVHVVARLLSERLPPPVVDYLLRRVTWIGVGMALLGSCGPPIAFADRPFLITLAADGHTREAIDRVKRVIAHECAHAWLNPEPPAGSHAVSAFWRQTVFDVPLDELPIITAEQARAVQAERAKAAHSERVADALTDVWGFRRATERKHT